MREIKLTPDDERLLDKALMASTKHAYDIESPDFAAGRLAGIREAAEVIEAHAKDMMAYRDHHYVAKHLRSAKEAILALAEGKGG